MVKVSNKDTNTYLYRYYKFFKHSIGQKIAQPCVPTITHCATDIRLHVNIETSECVYLDIWIKRVDVHIYIVHERKKWVKN